MDEKSIITQRKVVNKSNIYDYDSKYDRVMKFIQFNYRNNHELALNNIRGISIITGIHNYDETTLIVYDVVNNIK